MYLFFIEVLFAFYICNVSRGFRLYEDKAEFVTHGEVLNISGNESIYDSKNAWKIILRDRPSVVVVELRKALLDKVKLLVKDNEVHPGSGTVTLATFDSAGLQEVTPFEDNRLLSQAILRLGPSPHDNETASPSIHAMVDLLRGNKSHKSLVLVTMTKPSDEDFTNDLIKALAEKNCRLSILWTGSETTDDYLSLKAIAERTGGTLIFSGNNNEESSDSEYEGFHNFSDKIRFPERSTDNDDGEMSLIPRAANQKAIQKTVVPLIIEVASGSSLEVRPGAPTQVQFTVKNNMNIAVPVYFNSKFNGIIQNVQPPQALLPPAGTVTVIVNLLSLPSAQNVNAVGILTLSAAAANRVTSRSALISMTPQTITDNTAPKLYYKYDGDCSNYKEPQNCEHGNWNLEVTLQDEDSGLLKILSEPYGLLFHSEFIAGSKTPVTAMYSATCCQPVVHVWGEDLRGNYVKKSFDVFNQNLLAGEIASIVLGVLLLLLIIIIIIATVVLIKRRNQRNLIIPRASSGSR